MLRRISVILTCAFLISGCRSQSFVGRRVDNFKAYYNTFYNARESYDKGYKSISKRDEIIDRNHYLPLFVRPSGNTGIKDFDNAVVKSADLLRKHENSKWVDDALLLIGKAYFYQENIVGAIQKFREVIDRQSPLEDEARFWLARTLIISRSYDEAHAFLQESLVRDNVEAKWSASYRLALGELFVERTDWQAAADALSLGLKEAKDKELAARAQFLLGQVYETMGSPIDAAEAFQNVKRFGPFYELDFAAKISAIRVGGMSGGAERALIDLRKMVRDDKNFGYTDDLNYLRGRIIQAAGGADEAYNIYFNLLYDDNRTVPLKGDLRGKIHYALGELYRDLDRDYVLASTHFDTAAVSLSRRSASAVVAITGIEQFSSEAITDAAELKTNYGAYAGVYGDLVRMDSLLWLGSMDQEEFDDKILELRREQALILEEQRKVRETRLLEQQFRQGAKSPDPFSNRGLPPSKVNPGNTPSMPQSGFLFHRDAVRVDEGRRTFQVRWGDRPLVPNWRRIEAVRGQPAEVAVSEDSESESFDLDDPDTLPEIDTSDVPRDSLAQAQLKSRRAVARYELGNALFLALSMPDSAATWYRLVIEENRNEPVAQQSLYALAEVQKALGDSISSSRIYDQILRDFPETEFALRIREQRGELIEEAEPDSAALALEVYQEVFNEWTSGSTRGVIDQMILIAAAYPGQEASAKSLLAGAQVHLEQAGADTLAVLARLAVILPDSIIAKVWPEKFGKHAGPVDTAPSEGGEAAPSGMADDSTGHAPVFPATLRDSLDTVSLSSDSLDVSDPDAIISGETPSDSLHIVVVSPDSSGVGGLIPDSTAAVEPAKESVKESGEMPDSLVQEISNVSPDSLVQKVTADSLKVISGQVVIGDSLQAEPEVLPTTTIPSVGVADQNTGAEPGGLTSSALFVEDLFDAVVRDFRQTPYAKRALDMLSVINELRNPPIRLEEQPAEHDSTGVQEDSLFLAQIAAGFRSDSLGLSLDSLAQMAGGISDSVEAFDATGNPIKGRNNNQSDDRADGVAGERSEDSESPFPHFTVDEEVLDEDLEYTDSSVLKPMYFRRLDREVVGWTVGLEQSSDLKAAEKAVGIYAESMDTEDQRVMILGNVDESITNYLVAWGIFPSMMAMQEAVSSLETALPPGHFLLLMKSVVEE